METKALIDAKEVLAFLFDRADATLNYWSVYATAAATILSFLAAAKVTWLRQTTRYLLTLAFAIFAIGNLYILNEMRKQRDALITLLPSTQGYAPSLDGVAATTSPPSFWELLLFHLVLDFVVIATIWVIPHVRSRESR